MKAAINDFEVVNRRNVTDNDISTLRRNLTRECLHKVRNRENVGYGYNRCVRCDYHLKHYSFKCKDCKNQFCQTCHYNRH